MGDELGLVKGALVNFVVRKVKKLVPPFSLPGAVRFNQAIAHGSKSTFRKPEIRADDVAVLQYTGGTTGVSKGAVLLHRNIIANVLQSQLWNQPVMDKVPAGEQPTSVCALPLYHIFAFTVGMMLSMRTGGKLLLIPNPRDLAGTLKELSRHTFHSFPAVNTLFNGLAHHPDFDTVNWKNLKVSVGGGMAVQAAVARLWLQKTGCPICEGYGLSETSPSASCNPTTSTEFTGTIGVPLPSTWMKCIDDAGNEVPVGQAGEIAIKGPQVMAGYWQRPDETAKVMTPDGFFKSGDIGIMDARGYFRIVDRKKDMVLVSGFNVYPNEVEDVVALLDGVLECAVVGIPDEKTGEAVKLVIVRKDEALTQEKVREYCRANLTGYKQPRVIEFRKDLPKSPVGKILRRELRDAR
jgi:long-chain acyl-CoA synthetase